MSADVLLPLLAEFAVRLAAGLSAFVLITPWSLVPPKFFRTHCQVVLGLLVLAALDVGRGQEFGWPFRLICAAAVSSYLGSISWGLGLPRLGNAFATAMLACLMGLLALPILDSLNPALAWVLVIGRTSSAMLLGSTLTAMLLGHYYLAAPAMSIEPLRRTMWWIAGSLVVRIALSALGIWYWTHSQQPEAYAEPLFLAMRWGMGLAGPILATTLAWKTVAIRSTQSATGILYIAMTLVLFGEVSALVLARSVAWLA